VGHAVKVLTGYFGQWDLLAEDCNRDLTVEELKELTKK
jgi:hypothetical protein